MPPPDTDLDSPMWPGNDAKYAKIDKAVLPTTESLLTTAARVVPYVRRADMSPMNRGGAAAGNVDSPWRREERRTRDADVRKRPARAPRYWQGVVVPELIAGKNVIISAHGNSLRALVQYFRRADISRTGRGRGFGVDSP